MNRDNEAWKSIYGTTGGEFDERGSDALVLRAIRESRGEKAGEAVTAQESINEYQENPEKIGDLVKELIDLRGDRDVANGKERYSNIKTEGAWNKEMRAHVGADGLPRDWAHLTGFLKKNPDRIADVLKEIKDLKESANNANSKPVAQPSQEEVKPSNPSDPYAQVTFKNGERTGEYLGSNEGNEELTTERDYDRLSAAYDRLVREGRMTEEEAYRRKEIAFNSAIGMIEKSRQDYLDRINGRLPQQANGEVGDDDYDDDLDDDELDDSSDEEEDEIGEIRLELDALEKEFDNQKENRIREIEKMFNGDGDDDHKKGGLRARLGELYARNRRLFVFSKDREAFRKVKDKYSELLDEYLKLRTEKVYVEEQSKVKITEEDKDRARAKVKEELQAFIEKHPDASKEEIDAEKARLEKGASRELLRTDEIREKVNSGFLSEYLKQQNALEEATVNALDNGTIFRKAVSKIITNKKLKKGLAIVGGLAVIGATAGIATGAVAVSYGLTAAGAAAGAGRGAFSGALMSRQDSKNSAVRGFMSEEERKAQLENISVSDEGNVDTKNVANYLLASYSAANTADHKSNVKRTLISTGLGAIIGAAMSGVHFSSEYVVGRHTKYEYEQTGTKPVTESRLDVDIDSVNHKAGTGIEKLYYEMGGRGDFYSSGAKDIFLEAGRNNGLVYGKSGWTFPGPIGEWTSSNARAMVREAAEELAKQGLLPMKEVANGATEAVYDWVPHLVDDVAEDVVRNNIFGATAQGVAMVGAGLAGGAIAGRMNRRSNIPENPNTTPQSTAAEDIDRLFEVEGDEPASGESGSSATGNNPSAEELDRRMEELKREKAELEREGAGATESDTSEEPAEEESESEDEFAAGLLNHLNEQGATLSDELIAALTNKENDALERQEFYQDLWERTDDKTKEALRAYFDEIRKDNGEETFPGRAFRIVVSDMEG